MIDGVCSMPDEKHIDAWDDDAMTDDTVRKAVAAEIEEHKKQKNKVPAWDGEKVVIVDPRKPTDKPKS